MRRQKCDRKSPCTRCVQNKEGHLCTTEWTNGYNPAVHRKYPRKSSPTTTQRSVDANASLGDIPTQNWPPLASGPGLPIHLRTQIADSQAHCGPARSRSFSAASSSEGTRGQSELPTPSSTNVDFITYGRSDFSDISMGGLLREKEDYARNQALMEESLNQKRTKTCLDEAPSNSFSAAAQSVEVYHLQSLLPPKEQVLLMIDYHERCMAYWCGGIL